MPAMSSCYVTVTVNISSSSDNVFLDNTTSGTYGDCAFSPEWGDTYTTTGGTCYTYGDIQSPPPACDTVRDVDYYRDPTPVWNPPEHRPSEAQDASKNAEELLLSILTDEEKETYRLYNCVMVEALGRKFKLIKGRANNILELDEIGTPVARLCAHVLPNLPDEDNLAAQVLALRVAPELVMSVANRTDLNMYRTNLNT